MFLPLLSLLSLLFFPTFCSFSLVSHLPTLFSRSLSPSISSSPFFSLSFSLLSLPLFVTPPSSPSLPLFSLLVIAFAESALATCLESIAKALMHCGTGVLFSLLCAGLEPRLLTEHLGPSSPPSVRLPLPLLSFSDVDAVVDAFFSRDAAMAGTFASQCWRTFFPLRHLLRQTAGVPRLVELILTEVWSRRAELTS